MNDRQIAQITLEAAEAVHRSLGPRRREMNYEVTLAHELQSRGLQVERQVASPELDRVLGELKADLVVQECVAVMLYAIEPVTPAHEARLRRYLELCHLPRGFIFDFSEELFENGVTLVVRKAKDEGQQQSSTDIHGKP